jgi:multiple antibiotic resistance protein
VPVPDSFNHLFDAFILAFIPIFVSIDVPGALPIYVGMIADRDADSKRQIAFQATLTAFFVALGFVLLGNAIFHVMGITLNDFRIAGGILLFLLASAELLSGDSGARRTVSGEVGIFPIGTPLIIGPAALATLLMQHEVSGLMITVLALVANLVIVYICLRYADLLNRVLGPAGARAFTKVANLLLASIGVMMVRRGIEDLGWVKARLAAGIGN